ncbi:MAG: cytochrome c-type biogenesis protein CcmH [Gammaproteobacteria bacterium]|nr:cytochrome c-type biogenesis protein CcmH [Gammaproteobacteria bacterium]
MTRRFITLLMISLLLASGNLQATATLESFTFDTPGEEQRFKDVIEELRCLVCQNQSLVDSDAELAHDLRAEVYGMMQAGNSDAQIVDFLVERYGDFVLYSPPVKPSTWLIWFGPFVLLLVAILLLVRSLRRQQHTIRADISATDRQRLKQILSDDPANGDHSS